jgi:hypothetical protein
MSLSSGTMAFLNRELMWGWYCDMMISSILQVQELKRYNLVYSEEVGDHHTKEKGWILRAFTVA